MSQVKTLCCPECGSEDIVWQAWTDENDKFISGGAWQSSYAVCSNDACYYVNDEIKPILISVYKQVDSEYKQEVA
jgi:hypothetical protein